MSKHSLLFRKPGYPYYVYAPSYRESSSGIWTMHHLCHALNLLGCDAYVVASGVVNPQLKTPLLSKEVRDRHIQAGLLPIAVYPEVVSGNPMQAQTCVRYILNEIGKLTKRALDAGPDDLYFYYSEQFLGGKKKEEVNFLSMPSIDLEMFQPDPERKRDKVYLYQNRFPVDKIDFSLFPPDVEVLSIANPLPLSELADKLKSGRVLYSYEMSNTCVLAMACGCPVIYRTEGGLQELPAQFLIGRNGQAMSDEKDGLERATATVAATREAFAGQETVFWQQLEVFVDKTQQAAHRVTQMPRKKRLLVYSVEPPQSTSAESRLVQPFGLLHDTWELLWGIDAKGNIDTKSASTADAIVLHRQVPAVLPQALLENVFKLGKPVFYQADTTLPELCETLPARGATKGNLDYAVRHANAVVVPSAALADLYRKDNAQVRVLPGHVNFERFYRPVRMHDGAEVNIGLSETALHEENFALIAPALRALCARHAGKIKLHMMGARVPKGWQGQAGVKQHVAPPTYEGYVQTMHGLHLDIALLPLAAGRHGRGEIEWQEYSAAGVATACSDRPIFRSCAEDERTALIVADTEEAWQTALQRLVEDAVLRRRLARTAQARVHRQYSLQENLHVYQNAYLHIADGGIPAAAEPGIPAALVLDADGDLPGIERSLGSVGNSGVAIAIVLTTLQGDMPEWTDELRFIQTSPEEYADAVEQIAALPEFSWIAIMEAGEVLAPAPPSAPSFVFTANSGF